ncbi:MAG: EAL domain-containing protein [Pseudomonadota bacterium]
MTQAEPIETPPQMRSEILEAVARGAAFLDFQPVVQARAPSLVAFHEGLVRLVARDGTRIGPRDAIPVLEAEGMIAALDRLALDRALEVLSATEMLRVSINIAPGTIGDAGWLDRLRGVDRQGLALLDRLIVEVTETAPVDWDAAHGYLDAARALGPALMLDDFGAGATSLRYFRDYRFDGLKLDGAFTTGIDGSPDNQCLVRAMVEIAQHFDMLVVAEFVETEAEALCLRQLGVDLLQGHLYGMATSAPSRLSQPSRYLRHA